MKSESTVKILEEDLYKPVYEYLSSHGYAVHSEVKSCDIAAVKDDELVIVELKKGFNIDLLIQATQRQRMTDSVYVAIPRPKGGQFTVKWRNTCHLLRRLELGLILVSFKKGSSDVEIIFHPEQFDREKSKKASGKKRINIITEISGRHGNYNVGGICRKKIMTAYRENAIHIACCLERFGPMSSRQLRKLGTDPKKTYSILAHNHYGWFGKDSEGLYDLTPDGRYSLQNYPELVEHYMGEIGRSIEAGSDEINENFIVLCNKKAST